MKKLIGATSQNAFHKCQIGAKTVVRLRENIKHLVPEKLLMGQLVLRRAPLWKKEGIIFIHIPKNGGTSINNAIYGRFMGHYSIRDVTRLRPDCLRSLPSLAVTRNPWARAYSAWSFARKGTSMTDGAQIHNAQRYQSSEFESFERFVLEWLPSRNLQHEDYVFRPQIDFLLNRDGEVGVRHVGRIEEPESYLDYLHEAIGRPVEVGHMNQSSAKSYYRKAYTPEMRDVIARCYSADLDNFHYDF